MSLLLKACHVGVGRKKEIAFFFFIGFIIFAFGVKQMLYVLIQLNWIKKEKPGRELCFSGNKKFLKETAFLLLLMFLDNN